MPPVSVVKLQPNVESSEWYKGKEITTLQNDSIILRISFDKIYASDYAFDVEINNTSDQKIIIDPTDFSYEIKKEMPCKVKYVYFTRDPEIIIIELQRKYLQHNNFVQTQAMLNALGHLLLFSER